MVLLDIKKKIKETKGMRKEERNKQRKPRDPQGRLSVLHPHVCVGITYSPN
jgi:hypothetical protein